MLDYDSAILAIDQLKSNLMEKGEASELFGKSHDNDALAAILRHVGQTTYGEPLYPSCEEKAARLLYSVVKERPFTSGNKHIGAFLFLLYLKQGRLEHQLDSRAITTLTLLTAESKPRDKDLMIRLIISLLMAPSCNFH